MNLYLIGYRGCGKSTVAPLLASHLNWEYVDTDILIEQRVGQSIREIFLQQGEAEFRRLETSVICSLPAEGNRIVALGGGAVLAEANRAWLAANGKTVWLTAPPEILWRRIHSDQTSQQRRPDLTAPGGLAEVEKMLGTRSAIYAGCADYTIDVAEMSPRQIAAHIVDWWRAVDNKPT